MHELAIVGGGIAGAAAALRAGQYNIPTAWVLGDRETAKASRSKWVQNVDNMIGVHPEIVLRKLREAWVDRPDLLRALDVVGHLHITAQDMVNNVHRRLADHPGIVMTVPGAATALRRPAEDVFEVATNAPGHSHLQARAVVLATGVMDRQPLIATVVSRFVYLSRIYVPDLMLRGGNAYRIISDRVGSVRLVLDAVSGAVMQRIDYDPFGVVLQDTNPGFQPFGFAGGLYDPATGLVRFGARDYDPALGRWTAKDPIGFSGGYTSLYSYVGSDPVNRADPSGLGPPESDRDCPRRSPRPPRRILLRPPRGEKRFIMTRIVGRPTFAPNGASAPVPVLTNLIREGGTTIRTGPRDQIRIALVGSPDVLVLGGNIEAVLLDPGFPVPEGAEVIDFDRRPPLLRALTEDLLVIGAPAPRRVFQIDANCVLASRG